MILAAGGPYWVSISQKWVPISKLGVTISFGDSAGPVQVVVLVLKEDK